VKYIMSLADDKKPSQPLKGEYVTKDNGKAGTYMFSVSYTDKGANNVSPQTGSKTLSLRSAKFKANTFDASKETMNYKVDGIGEIVIALNDKGFVAYNDIDFSGIGAFKIMGISSDDRTTGGKVEIRIDSPTGALLGTGDIEKGIPKPTKVAISPTAGIHNLYLVFSNPNNGGKPLYALMDITVEKDGGSVSGSGK
jgi:cytochrome c